MAATPDLSRITDVEERNKAAELYAALTSAEAAIEAALDNIPEETAAAFDEKKLALAAEYERQVRELNAEFDNAHGLAALQAARDAAVAAFAPYAEGPLRLQRNYYTDDGIQRCALTGLPLWTGDDVLVSGRAAVLRAAVLDYGQGVPSYEPDDSDEFDVSEEDDEEEGEVAEKAAAAA